MSRELGQEPAFMNLHFNGVRTYEYNGGMSKRFYAACVAMQGFLSNADWTKTAKIPDDFDEYKTRVCSAAYEFADELLKQENE